MDIIVFKKGKEEDITHSVIVWMSKGRPLSLIGIVSINHYFLEGDRGKIFPYGFLYHLKVKKDIMPLNDLYITYGKELQWTGSIQYAFNSQRELTGITFSSSNLLCKLWREAVKGSEKEWSFCLQKDIYPEDMIGEDEIYGTLVSTYPFPYKVPLRTIRGRDDVMRHTIPLVPISEKSNSFLAILCARGITKEMRVKRLHHSITNIPIPCLQFRLDFP